MTHLPCVTVLTRERISREFDDRGPDVCRAEITFDLEVNNPEWLDMATRCARDVGDTARIMTGLCMFYRLLAAEARVAFAASHDPGEGARLQPLPQVSRETRASVVERIDTVGAEEFTRVTIAELERNNPELLLMAHNFAEYQADYGGLMQGFALLYACLLAQSLEERGSLH